MTLISSPVFVCFVLVLAMLVGVLVGRLWSKRMYDAVWRDGASWVLFKVRSSYIHLPRKLRLVLEATEFRMRVGWPEPLQPTRGEAEPTSDDAKQEGGVE